MKAIRCTLITGAAPLRTAVCRSAPAGLSGLWAGLPGTDVGTGLGAGRRADGGAPLHCSVATPAAGGLAGVEPGVDGAISRSFRTSSVPPGVLEGVPLCIQVLLPAFL